MGAWGYGIRQDDLVCDVIGVFEDLLKAGKSVREATEGVKSKFTGAMKDPDDGPAGLFPFSCSIIQSMLSPSSRSWIESSPSNWVTEDRAMNSFSFDFNASMSFSFDAGGSFGLIRVPSVLTKLF